MEGGFAFQQLFHLRSCVEQLWGKREVMTPLTDQISSPVSCVAMTHNLCVECESAFVPVCI